MCSHRPYCWSVYCALWSDSGIKARDMGFEVTIYFLFPSPWTLFLPYCFLKDKWKSQARIIFEPKCSSPWEKIQERWMLMEFIPRSWRAKGSRTWPADIRTQCAHTLQLTTWGLPDVGVPWWGLAQSHDSQVWQWLPFWGEGVPGDSVQPSVTTTV